MEDYPIIIEGKSYDQLIAEILAKVKFAKGEKGDSPTEEELLALIRPLIPPAPKDGHTPTDSELLALIKPLIRDPIPGRPGRDGIDGKGKDGKDGTEIEPEVIAEKLNTLKGAVDLSVIRGAVTKTDLEKYQGKILDGMAKMDDRVKAIDQRWHGAGLGSVSHDLTLTGTGNPSSPLSVVPSGVTTFAKQGSTALTGAVTISGGSNVTLTQVGQNISIASTASATPATPVGAIQINNPLGTFGSLGGMVVDVTGNARGINSIDIQSRRLIVTNVASGQDSATYGLDNTASGGDSVAIGTSNQATNDNAVAFGESNIASNLISMAFGNNNTVGGFIGLGVGYANLVNGSGANALGGSNTASGNYSLALGFSNHATDKGSTASGYTNTASGVYSTAVGYNNTASSRYGVALGYSSQATGNDSSVGVGASALAQATGAVALGTSVTANAAGAIAIGSNIGNSTANTLQIGVSNTAKTTIDTQGDMYPTGLASNPMEPVGDIKIPAHYSSVVVDHLSIAAGKTLTLGVGAYLAII